MRTGILDFPSHEMILELEKQLTYARVENWIHHDLFTFQWWLLMVVLIVPWIIWWRYVDKRRLLEISLAGAMVLIICSYLDAVLSEFGLWSYNFEVIPVWPRLISADFAALPVLYMFIYQYFRRWKHFVWVMIIAAAVWSFICEPGLKWLDIYHPYSWKYYYSFPIYIAIGVLVKWLVQMLLVCQNHHAEPQSKID